MNTYNYTVQRGYYNFNYPPSLINVINLVYNDGHFGSVAQSYLMRLSNLIDGLDGLNPPTNSLYVTFANQIINYENEIVNNATLASVEKRIVLAAHSIARYSSNYWMNYYYTPDSQVARQAPTKSWFKWKDVLGDDVAGGIGGAAGGALVGAFAGEIGALPGAGFGALGGGVGGSATGAAKQVWNRFFSN